MSGAWVSVHAYRQGGLDPLINEAVVPAARALTAAGQVDGWFFLRYWEGGTHVRLRVRPAGGSRDEVTEALLGPLADYLRAHPAGGPADQAAYTAMAAGFAEYEGLASYERVLRPADTAAAVPYRPEHDSYGHGESLAAVEDHFVESSRIAAEVLASGAPMSRRRGLALSTAMVTLAVLRPDLDRLAAEYASADGGHRDRYPISDAHHQAYAAQRDRLAEQVEGVWSLLGAGGGTDTLGAWLGTIRALRDRLSELADAGLLTVRPPRSPLAWQRGMTPVEGIAMRCAHLINNRMGVSMADEMFVTYLMARTLVDRGERCAR
ncbi:lantibiotic dehydratase C-terminal domain-containing protein [Rhizohabitans arisaemae]|uniref:lantibiotic dehydratase C-terminal domain-containing protein n=1 Tax=Rhizohabitans arisaemae TaxID=2720610 RepID=UPI0024B06859|nr:lantibiotic dehydratase C-terminal domain-containing protein [Rhizohabitans arisaemae]